MEPDSAESMHALNVLCVRLVFCLFCEDADLFPKDAFLHYLKDVSSENIHKVVDPLFLDDLKAKFIDIRDSEDLTPRQKKNRYARLHQQMCTLKFFEILRTEWIQNGGTVTLAA